jgi:hypothetical protein
MRDPKGSIEFQNLRVVRNITDQAAVIAFLKSNICKQLVKDGLLIPYKFGTSQIESPRLPFVSFPHEWCDEQLRRAARLTLVISQRIAPHGFELKDASAWNVIFQGNVPVFCDLYSFQPIELKRWWAFGQFVRHFVLPLMVSKMRGVKPHQLFSFYRDGLPPDAAGKIMGSKRFLTRYWPLMLQSRQPTGDQQTKTSKSGKPVHEGLYRFCETLLGGLGGNKRQGHWSSYTATRSHYSQEASSEKYATIAKWIAKLAPSWVVDLGCNTGEYSQLAAGTGANVIAIDLDHDSIQHIVLENDGSKTINPLIVNLTDMVGGRGWRGSEFPSLMDRLYQKSDLILMLALIHHLIISESISIKDVAQLAADLSSRYLIVELLDEADPMVIHLCQQRNRQPQEFGMKAQEDAFGIHFELIDSQIISGGARKICLFQKKPK